MPPAATAPTLERSRAPLRARLAALYRRSPFSPYWIDTRHIRRSIAGLAPQARGWMLDVGVGERPYGALFAPHVARYVGLEYPPSCENLSPGITAERSHFLQGAVDVWGDGSRLPFASGRFDTGLMIEVLEHLAHPDACVAEVARVLAPGGRLLLTVPFIAPLHALPHDYTRWTPAGLSALLGRHGLAIESITPRGNYASAAGNLLAQWLLRSFAARSRHRDGAVSLSRWRAPLVLPFVALAQLGFVLCERFSDDRDACLGYAVVARKAAG